MKREIAFSEKAIDQAAGFLDDASGLAQTLAAIDLLADDPHPPASFGYGSEALRRPRAGRYRVLYQVDDDRIVVLNAGRRSAR